MTLDPQDAESAPPEFAEQFAPPKRTVWPMIIGLISIALGALGLVGTPVSLLIRRADPANQKINEALPAWYSVIEPAIDVVGVAFAVLLLVAGIALMRRRQMGQTLHLAYAYATLVWAVAAVPLSVLVMDRAMAVTDMPAEIKAVSQIAAFAGLALGWGLAIAHAAFLIIWFMRRKIRDEITTWRAAKP